MIDDQIESIAFVVKVAERCNLACTYCYFFFGGDDTFDKHPPLIALEKIDQLKSFIEDAVNRNGLRDVTIGFHGGEPLLMSKKHFREACRRLQGLQGQCNLQLRMQTNGSLIDDEWINIFAEFNVYVGVSFDGPEAIHDTHRLTKAGKGSYQKALRGWNLLRDGARAGRLREPGILCVIDPTTDGAEIFDHFVNGLGARYMDFLLPDVTHDKLEFDERFVLGCGDYLIAVSQSWFGLGASDVNVRFLSHIVGPLLSDELMQASALTKNDPLSVITISSDGTIGPDDTIRILDPRFRSSLPSLERDTLSDVLRHDVWQELRRSRVLASLCRSCDWIGVCGGGNRVHRFSPERGFDNASGYCKSLLRMYNYIASRLVLGGYPEEQMSSRLHQFGEDRFRVMAADAIGLSPAV